MRGTWRIGDNMPRREDIPLLRGEAAFFAGRRSLADAVMVILRSRYASGTIVRLDPAMAAAVPDVLLVLTARDLVRNGPIPCLDTDEVSLPAFQTVLAEDNVHYVGQPVAAIVATTRAAAHAGLEALLLEISPHAPTLSVRAGPEAHVRYHRSGDAETATANAELVLEGSFRFHRISASPLEPRGVEARIEGDPAQLIVCATTQVAVAARDHLARLLDWPRERLRYDPIRLGGGFGLKEAFYPEEVLVATAVVRLGCRVRWEETRYEHFVGSSHARQGEARLRIALTRQGEVLAIEVDGRSDIGAAYGYVGNSPGAMMGAMVRGPYRIPHMTARTASILTNKTPLNVYRGAGHPQAVFAMERMMDKAARVLGLDRAEIRRRNFIPRDAFPYVRGTPDPGGGRPIIYDSGDYELCFDEVLDAIGYKLFAARRARHEAEHPSERLGLGLSFMVELTATAPDETVAIEVGSDGQIVVFAAPVAMGQGTESALSQILSAALGIGIEQIAIRCGDNRDLPSGGGAYGGRGAAVCGSALQAAAKHLEERAMELAAERFGVALDTLGWSDGGVVGMPERNAPLSLAELLDGAPPEVTQRLAATATFKVSSSATASAAHAAIVAVEIDTGMSRVLDYAVAHDCGTILNPRGVDGQVIGGVMQGIGAVFYEDLPYNHDGTPLARGFLDYLLPVAADVPRFHLRHVETPSPLNPLGMKGAGEGGFTGAPAALVGALEDALCEFAVELDDDGPYTPARLLELIRSSTKKFR